MIKSKINSNIKYQNSKQNFCNVLLVILVLSFVIYPAFAQHQGHSMQTQTKEELKPKVKKPASTKAVYYCPMHPTYTSDKPGDCPICNMKLVKKSSSSINEEKLGASEEKAHLATDEKDRSFYISPEKQQLIGVKIGEVSSRPFEKLLRTVGRVAFDPELYKSQTEYIEVLKTLDKVKESGEQAVIERASSFVEAARLKLELSGLSKEQIEDLSIKKENDLSLLISYSESVISWVYATIYEYELEYLKIGQSTSIKAVAYPDREFKGEIVAIDPVFDTMTRSVRARIRVDNIEGLLKPNMYVDVEIISDMGIKLSVPKEAVMDTGLRKIVFVSLPEGRLESREVKTGISIDDYVEVIDGLKEGENVVTSGNFLIDSESKLKSALEGAGHQH